MSKQHTREYRARRKAKRAEEPGLQERREFLRSLAKKVVSVELMLPEHVVDLLHLRHRGVQAAAERLALFEAGLDRAIGMLCLACDTRLGEVAAGAIVIVREDNPAAVACATMPLCWHCAERPDVRRLVEAGVKRSLFPNGRFFKPDQHAPGHA